MIGLKTKFDSDKNSISLANMNNVKKIAIVIQTQETISAIWTQYLLKQSCSLKSVLNLFSNLVIANPIITDKRTDEYSKIDKIKHPYYFGAKPKNWAYRHKSL